MIEETTPYETIITQVINFADGSRIIVKVETPKTLRLNTAGLIYYSLIDRLDLIERYAQYQQKLITEWSNDE
jgi:hypothetical protein